MTSRPSSIATIALLAGLLVSCGNDGGSGQSTESAAGFAPLSQRLSQEQGYVQDSEGNWVARSNRRSQFENRTPAGIRRGNANSNRRFNAAEYQPAEWTRTSSSRPESFTGDTDGSTFQTTAAAQGSRARQSGARARTPESYRTGEYGTGSSRENRARRLPRPGDTQTENRRDNVPPPEIIDWRQQRELTVDQSRSLLSR